MQSMQAIGYVAKPTKTNQEYVATLAIQGMLRKHMTISQIALAWNQGNAAQPCHKGYNKLNVYYDSCGYVQTVIKNYNSLN